MTSVRWSKGVQKQLEKVPFYIADKFRYWVQAVEEEGIHTVRQLTGYHDEPLRGKRQGQRSVRLSRSYRIIYVEKESNWIEIVEVNKHDY